jgi:hypothetical protein
MSSSIIISCAGDSQLARKVNDYLIGKIAQSSNTINISLYEDEVEIVSENPGVSNDGIKNLLHDFIKSNSELADNYSITEFNDNVFVVGIQKSLDELTLNCEICGYIASSEDDLNMHKRTHGLIFIL